MPNSEGATFAGARTVVVKPYENRDNTDNGSPEKTGGGGTKSSGGGGSGGLNYRRTLSNASDASICSASCNSMIKSHSSGQFAYTGEDYYFSAKNAARIKIVVDLV